MKLHSIKETFLYPLCGANEKGRSHQAWYDQEMYRGEGCVLRRGLTAPSVGTYGDRAQGRYDAQGHSLARDARSATRALTPIR